MLTITYQLRRTKTTHLGQLRRAQCDGAATLLAGRRDAPITSSAYGLGTSRLLKSDYFPCSNGNSSAIAPTIATSAQFYRCSTGGTLATPT
jgi:hypothetical protein